MPLTIESLTEDRLALRKRVDVLERALLDLRSMMHAELRVTQDTASRIVLEAWLNRIGEAWERD